MKTEIVKLKQVRVNKNNPRTITSDKFQKLMNSILVLPRMLELRPVVVDNVMTALGGNMRLQALNEIATCQPEAITERLASLSDYQRKTDGEKQVLKEYWGKWLKNPTVYIINASELSEDEKKQFIIKDNVQFGQWDYDKLANQWDNAQLNEMGMDVWETPTTFTPYGADGSQVGQSNSEEDDDVFDTGLPPELQGVDLNPSELPKIEGDDETARERIIIVYRKEQAETLAGLLGIDKIDKIVWNLDDIIGQS